MVSWGMDVKPYGRRAWGTSKCTTRRVTGALGDLRLGVDTDPVSMRNSDRPSGSPSIVASFFSTPISAATAWLDFASAQANTIFERNAKVCGLNGRPRQEP